MKIQEQNPQISPPTMENSQIQESPLNHQEPPKKPNLLSSHLINDIKKRKRKKLYFVLIITGIMGLILALVLFFSKGGHEQFKEQLDENVPWVVEKSFRKWKQKFQKTYSTKEEEIVKLKTFFNNSKLIDAHNSNTTTNYTLGENQFMDLNISEFSQMYLSPLHTWNGSHQSKWESGNHSYHHERRILRELAEVENEDPMGTEMNPLPERPPTTTAMSHDWRYENAVSAVSDQGQCDSCYAFAALAVLESAYFIKHGYLYKFSEQAMIDCELPDAIYQESDGCKGGWVSNVYEYMKTSYPDFNSSYPYVADENTCQAVYGGFGAFIEGYYWLDDKTITEKVLRDYVKQQPVAWAFDANCTEFMLYYSGVLPSYPCGKGFPNHAAAIVGYYDLTEGSRYWTIKNSWGTQWGLDGFFYWTMVPDDTYMPFWSTNVVIK